LESAKTPYEFLSPGSKIKRTVGLDIKLDEELQALYLEERKIAMERGHAVQPTFTDVVTTVIKLGILERKKWTHQMKALALSDTQGSGSVQARNGGKPQSK